MSSAEEVANLVIAVAKEATAAGSYGIAGAIIETATGKVVKTMPNRVLKRLSADVATSKDEAFKWDPTAHGERQLVYWYYENREKEKLPNPQKLTLVTSIDPCAMCTGALLTVGFNVGVVSPDQFSGINYQENFSLTTLPEPLRSHAEQAFGYYGVEGGRIYQGSDTVAFYDSSITKGTFAAAESQFEDHAGTVRDSRHANEPTPDQLSDPATDSSAAAIRDAFKSASPEAFTLKLKDFRKPDDALKKVLVGVRDQTPQAKNAVAFIDPFGNLIRAAADTFDVSPAHTAYLNVAQSYVKTRFDLVNDTATTKAARDTLTAPKYGTYVFLVAPTPTESTTIETLGAYGSTVMSIPQNTPSNFQYYNSAADGTETQLKAVISTLPPLYTRVVQIDPQPVAKS